MPISGGSSSHSTGASARSRRSGPPCSTPIAMPGKASIRAALNPTEGDWKYYVLIDADGHHAFATTFAEHEANVAIARAKGLVP